MEVLSYCLLISAFIYAMVGDKVEGRLIINGKTKISVYYLLFNIEITLDKKEDNKRKSSDGGTLPIEIFESATVTVNNIIISLPIDSDFFPLIASFVMIILSAALNNYFSYFKAVKTDNSSILIKSSKEFSFYIKITLKIVAYRILMIFIRQKIKTILKKGKSNVRIKNERYNQNVA